MVGSRRRRTAALLVFVGVSLLGACRDEDLDYLTATPTPPPAAVPFHPRATYFIQETENAGSLSQLRERLPFEPVLPTYLPGEMQVLSVIAQPTLREVSFAFLGPGGSFTLSEWQAGGSSSAGEPTRVGRFSGRLATSTTGALLLTWEACDLTFTLTTSPFPPGAMITQDELVRIGESINRACE